MQVVIEIPDDEYEIIKGCTAPMTWVEHLIKNGIPLPKGHGRLIDADKLNRKDVNFANTPMNFIDTAPTIIEADKE